MSRPVRYPRARTLHGDDPGFPPGLSRWHPAISVQYAEGDPPILACGDSWCSGGCGLPALVIPGPRELKMHSSMVACGALMKGWRVEWQGARVEVPAEHREDFQRRIWP